LPDTQQLGTEGVTVAARPTVTPFVVNVQRLVTACVAIHDGTVPLDGLNNVGEQLVDLGGVPLAENRHQET